MSQNRRITGASLCVTSWSDTTQACRVSSQLVSERKPQQNIFQPNTPSVWKKEELTSTGAMPLTPLASVSWDHGREVRLFYLNSHSIIYEFVLTAGSNVWKLGTIDALNIKATPGAGLAATLYQVPSTTIFQVRVYYQDGKGVVNELVHEGRPGSQWKTGTTVTIDALLGTELAAVAYPTRAGQLRTHLFYQTKDLNVWETIFSDGSWENGDFIPTEASGRTPIAATTFVDNSGNRAVQVYWRNDMGQVYYGQSTRDIWGDNKITSNKIPAGYGLGVIQWNKGFNFRLYFQKFDGPELVEWQSNDGGVTWVPVGTF